MQVLYRNETDSKLIVFQRLAHGLNLNFIEGLRQRNSVVSEEFASAETTELLLSFLSLQLCVVCLPVKCGQTRGR